MPVPRPAETGPKTAVIAGATGNVGAATARELARRGYRVVMLGRNLERIERHAAAISADLSGEGAGPGGELLPLEVDLTDAESVARAARAAADRLGAIDALVLSAVTLTQGPPTILPDGSEAMFATNVLGPFRLALYLGPAVAAAGGLVVHVVAPFRREIDWDDLQGKRVRRPMVRYERSKACNRIVAGEMARRFSDRWTTVAFDPGFVVDRSDPDLAARWPKGPTGLIWRIYAALAAKPPSVAGEALADLVTETPDRAGLNGARYELGSRAGEPDPLMNDRALGARLWEALERLAFPPGAAGTTVS